MKPRKVVVTLELTTNIPLKVLRDRHAWKRLGSGMTSRGASVPCETVIANVEQAQANVVK